MKYWISDKGNDKLTVITKEVIYNTNPSRNKIDIFKRELQKGSIPKEITGIPLGQIKTIQINDRSNTIQLIKNNSDNEIVEVDARDHKEEIFTFFKEEIYAGIEVHNYVENVYKKIFKLLIPIGVILFFTIRTYTIASGMEMGYEYEIVGGRARSGATGGILLGLADTLGSTGVLALGSILGLIPLYLLIQGIRKKKNITEIRLK